VIEAEYHARLVSQRVLPLSLTQLHRAYAGDVEGTASFKETRRDPAMPNSTYTRQGEGAMVPILGLMPQWTLIVDLVACTISLDGGVSLNVLTTDPDGKTSRQDELVAVLHKRAGPLDHDLTGGYTIGWQAASVPWAAQNRAENSFAPLGYAAQLADADGRIGTVGIFIQIVPRPYRGS